MKFSVWPMNQQPLAEIIDVAKHAEATGWDGVWMADHLLPFAGPVETEITECWTAMTALIASVPRVRVGSLVLSNTFRPPGLLAKMAATLGSIADGRFVLGIGAGWQENEHEAFGIELPPVGPRISRLDEACQIIRELLTTGSSSFSGRYYTVSEARALPPDPKVPMLLGVKGDRSIGVAARWADEWNSWTTPELFRERFAVLQRHCDAIGRDVSEIHCSTQTLVRFTAPGEELPARLQRPDGAMLTGGSAEMQDQMGQWAAAGVDEFIVPDFAIGRGAQRLEAFDRFITEVAAPFR